MTFDSLRVKVGRRPVTIVEVDVDYCSNTYGSAPCTAVLGTSGSSKCFNTFQTCQDKANFAKTTKTYRFCSENALLPVGDGAIPCITKVDIAPTQLDPKGISVSASVNVTFKDFPHHDRGTDPYIDDRDYDATGQGTFWGKFRARNPFLVNRPMRVMTGYVGDDGVVYTRTRHYFIDRLELVDAKGQIKLVGKDLLRFSEGEDLQVPALSKGILDAGIDADDTSLTLSPAGVGDSYGTSGRIRIDDELIDFSGKTGDQLTGLTRAVGGTTAASHDADSKVQECAVYSSDSIPDILTDILTNYAGVDASYIPASEWSDENDTWLGSFTSSVTLSDPKDVKEILKEVLLASGSILWWDEVEAKLKWRVIVPLQPVGEVRILDETQHILAGSLKVKDIEKDRVSRVFMFLDEISAVADTDRKNFKTITATIDTESESVNAYNASKLLEILNRWIPISLPLADEIAQRFLVRYATTPRQIEFKLDAKDFDIRTGDIVDVVSRLLQRPDGSNGSVRFLVTECRENPIGSQGEYTAMQIYPEGGGASVLFAANAQADWTSASDSEKENYMFISDDAGVMSDLAYGPRIG